MDATMKQKATSALEAMLDAALVEATAVVEGVRKARRRRMEATWRQACEVYARYLNDVAAAVDRMGVKMREADSRTVVAVGFNRGGEHRDISVNAVDEVLMSNSAVSVVGTTFCVEACGWRNKCEVRKWDAWYVVGRFTYKGDFGYLVESHPHPVNLGFVVEVINALGNGGIPKCTQKP